MVIVNGNTILVGTYTLTVTESGTLYSTATGSITSAQLRGSLSDENGTGVAIFNSATLPEFSGITLLTKAGTTTSGDLWNDSTQKAVQSFVGGIEQTLSGIIFTQTATRTIADTVTETSLLTTGVGTLTLPANFFVSGKMIRLTIIGNVADTGTPTVTVKLKHGAVTIIDSGAITLTSLTGTEEFQCICDIVCRTAGAAGASVVAGCIWFEYDTTTGAGAVNVLNVPLTTVTTVDTTASGALDLTFQWGTASPSNTISSLIVTVEVLN